MKLYKTQQVILLEHADAFFILEYNWDELINREDLQVFLTEAANRIASADPHQVQELLSRHLLPPVGQQEIWAAGVTYLRSRDARMEESQSGGGADFYQKVYTADRPELFFKALPHRVSGPGAPVHIRKDSTWNVPEPELTLCINRSGSIVGYTVGNDMSSRSIEGENPLYLPQAKLYDRSAALGPCVKVSSKPLPGSTAIQMQIHRSGHIVFSGTITIDRIKRSFTELVSWLYRECSFPYGCYLMTGTGIVPPDTFTLQTGDLIEIDIAGIGVLRNAVALRPF